MSRNVETVNCEQSVPLRVGSGLVLSVVQSVRVDGGWEDRRRERLVFERGDGKST